MYFSLMDNIIMKRLKAIHNQRKESLGDFLTKKAEMLRNQRIKDGLIAEDVELKGITQH